MTFLQRLKDNIWLTAAGTALCVVLFLFVAVVSRNVEGGAVWPTSSAS